MKSHRFLAPFSEGVVSGIIALLMVGAAWAAPVITGVLPSPGVVADFTQMTVTFSEPVDGVEADDLLVNGEPARSVAGADTTYVFGFPQPAAGIVEIRWDGGHGIVDRATPPNAFDATLAGSVWQYTLPDLGPPGVASLLPVAGATVRHLRQIEVIFSEPVIGVDAGDLLVNGRAAALVQGEGAGPYRFQFVDPGIGRVEATWKPGHGIVDLATPGNVFNGLPWSYGVDPQSADVVLNEFLAANQSGLRDEDGEPEDWIELLNRGTNAVHLAGWSLTDERDDPGKWTFPSITLNPGQFLIVFASGKDRRIADGTKRLHTNFKLNPAGEYLALFDAESPRGAATELGPEFPLQRRDIAYGRTTTGEWSYFARPTPGASNPPMQSFAGVVAAPAFSIKRGWFTEPFALTLTTDTAGASIYFTLDGSEPSPDNGQPYSAPLRIESAPGRAAAMVRAAAYRTDYLPSAVTTRTYLFPERVLAQPATPPGFPADWVSSITTRGDYEMDPQVLGVTHDAARARAALTNLPSVSVVMKVEDLFGPTRGVYTRRNDQNQQAASAELIWPDGRKGFQIDCGLEIQGGSSTGNAGNDWKSKKLSMRLLFKGDFGPGKLEYPLFEASAARRFDTLVLDAGLNYTWNHMTDTDQRNRAQYVRDQFMSDLQNSVGGVAPHGRFVHLYLNGLYWGLYDLHERPDDSFCAEHFGGAKEEYDVLKHTGTTLVSGNLTAWNAMFATARAGLKDNTRYEALQQDLDVPWFIDYMIVNFWGGNTDWAAHNWYAARRRRPGPGFRFISWDAEHVLKSATENRLNANDRTSPTEMFTLLRTNAEFRLQFADRVHRHFFHGATFYVDPQRPGWDPTHPERNVPASLYMKRIGEIDPAIVCESARWGDVATARAQQPYTRDVEWLRELNSLLGLTNSSGNTANYFPRRSSVVLDQFRAAGLYPLVAAPEFSLPGGLVARGFKLSMTSREGTIYYTTDSSDPRLYGVGEVAPTASAYVGEWILSESALIKARVWSGGVWSALGQATFSVGELAPALRFTEIMYHPPGGDAYEFVEVGNVGRVPLDLSLMSLEGVDYTFPMGVGLGPNDVVVLSSAADPAAFAARYPGVRVAGVFGGNLDNGGERLALKNRDGGTVTSVEYGDANGWARAADGGGFSLEQLQPAAVASDPTNWRASAVPLGSPGQFTPAPWPPGLRFNEIRAENGSAMTNPGSHSDWIELQNPTSRDIDASGYSLTDDGDRPRKFVFPGGTRVSAGGYLLVWCDAATNAPDLHAGFALDRDGEHLFLFDRQTNVLDAVSFGRQMADRTVGLADPGTRTWGLMMPTPGTANQKAALGSASQLIINEWLAHATTNSADWVELHNRDLTLPVALTGLSLSANGTAFQIRSLSVVPPGGFARLWADERSGAGHLDFKLPAEGGRIELHDESGQLIDRIEYADQAEGVSQGRLPDGSDHLVALPAPTPGQSNAGIATPDSDGDGLPDEWELAHGLNPRDSRDAVFDTDGDGLTNAEEFLSGTDPRRAASSMTLTAEREANGQIVLRFPAVEKKSYTLQYRESLIQGAWFKLRDFPAQTASGTVSVLEPEANLSATRFYRLVTPQLP